MKRVLNKIKSLLENVNSISKNAVIGRLVKIKGSKIGSGVVVRDNSKVEFSHLLGSTVIGSSNYIKNSTIHRNFSSGEGCRIVGCNIEGNVKLGRFTSLWGPNLDVVTGKEKIIIGNFCSIARNVLFQTYNHNHKKITSYFVGQNFFDERWENERVSKGDIIIENDVWIGAHCVILGGLVIGNGAVVASNSVVNKDVPPYGIVAGNPAKVVGYRFDEETINELLKMEWWNWSAEKLNANKHLFENEWDSNFKVD